MQPSAVTQVDSVLHALMRIGRLMRQPLAGDDLEPGTVWFLKQLAGAEALRLTDLAARCGLDASTVSRHVTQLHRQGLVERTPDPLDGRAQRVVLSLRGQQGLENALRRRRDLMSRSLAGWPSDDVARLDQLLERFVGTAERLAMEKQAVEKLRGEQDRSIDESLLKVEQQ